jgi:hypothetical protein
MKVEDRCKTTCQWFICTVAAIFHHPPPGKQLRKVKAKSAIHLIHKFRFLPLLVGERFFPDYRLALFSFSCAALGMRSRLGFGVFLVEVNNIRYEIDRNLLIIQQNSRKN